MLVPVERLPELLERVLVLLEVLLCDVVLVELERLPRVPVVVVPCRVVLCWGCVLCWG